MHLHLLCEWFFILTVVPFVLVEVVTHFMGLVFLYNFKSLQTFVFRFMV